MMIVTIGVNLEELTRYIAILNAKEKMEKDIVNTKEEWKHE